MPATRMAKLLENARSERRFAEPLYKVAEDRGFRVKAPTLGRDMLTPFAAAASRIPKPADLEWRAMDEEIKAANYILQIENDTEEDDFVPYSHETLSSATGFLRRQMIHAHAANVVGMGVPQIVPADHGSVDLFWEKHDRTLLVNFPSSGEVASYYGKKPKSEISGRFDPSEARPELVFWLVD